MKPYCIVSPDYDHTSGGIKVMWGLFGHLLARGHEVYMNRRPEKHTIAVYPEIVNGNPANGETVVRYILNKPGVMWNGVEESPVEFDNRDILFCFSKIFGDYDNYMFLPVINMDIFKDQGKKRTKRAVFEGKGENLGLHEPGIIVDRSLATDQQELADFLNECEVLYSYDPVSAMTEVARLCGCRVVLLNDTYSKEDYEKYEPGINGISFGEDTGEKLDVDAFRSHYNALREDFELKLTKFIEVTQK